MILRLGTFLQNRYEILERIGIGGMSVVYKARCHKLNRLVAIKVLKEEFSKDEAFVKKFKLEAQAAAMLSHPNIVSVYDVIDEEELHYIVMEYVDGVTLKSYIVTKKGLGIKEAIGIAIQIAQGIEMAHKHQIIHRDIKPQNMMLSKNAKVKVMDFGIARAVTKQTLSTTAIGTVHYISPEQASGQASDMRSDIYSLGITLYEMVTGRLPFEGENTVNVALAHLNEQAIPPSRYNPEVSPRLESIIQKCMRKNPDRRYQNMAELLLDLRSVMNVRPAPMSSESSSPEATRSFTVSETQMIRENQRIHQGVSTSHNLSRDTSYNNTSLGETQNRNTAQNNILSNSQNLNSEDGPEVFPERRTPVAVTYQRQESRRNIPRQGMPSQNVSAQNIPDQNVRGQSLSGEGNRVRPTENTRPKRPTVTLEQSTVPIRASYQNPKENSQDSMEEENDEKAQKMDKIMAIAGVVLGLVIIIIILVLFFRFGKALGLGGGKGGINIEESTLATNQVKMPDVVGLSEELADKKLKDNAIQMKVKGEEYSDDIPKGAIVSQDPKADEIVSKYSNVEVILSKGSNKVDITTLGITKMKVEDAKTALESQGFSVEIKEISSDTVAIGYVVSFSPEKPEKGTLVTLYKSTGKAIEYEKVPSITHKSEEEAKRILLETGFTAGKVRRQHDAVVPKDYVISQEIEVGRELEKGTAVGFVVSDGPPVETTTVAPSTTAETPAPTISNNPPTMAPTAATTVQTRYKYTGSINTTYELENLIGPGAANTSVTVLVRLRQNVNGQNVYTTLMDARRVQGDTILPIRFSYIEGAYGVDQGYVEIVTIDDGNNYNVIKTFDIEFFKGQ